MIFKQKKEILKGFKGFIKSKPQMPELMYVVESLLLQSYHQGIMDSGNIEQPKDRTKELELMQNLYNKERKQNIDLRSKLKKIKELMK